MENSFVGINVMTKNNGVGKYARDLSKIIEIHSFILDKSNSVDDYIGVTHKMKRPYLTSGYALNRVLLPGYINKIFKGSKLHYISPIKPSQKNGIVTIHDLYCLQGQTYLDNVMCKICGLYANWDIITDSNSTKNLLIKHYKYHEDQITTVPLAVDDKVFHDKHLDKQYILTVGDGPHKNNLELDKIIPEKYMHLHVGKQSKHSVGYVDDIELNSLYNKSFCSIRYSDMEGFGIPAIESLMAGCPIILKRINTFEEILGDNYPLYVDTLQEIPEMIEYAKENRNEVMKYFEKYRDYYKIERFEKEMKKYYEARQ